MRVIFDATHTNSAFASELLMGLIAMHGTCHCDPQPSRHSDCTAFIKTATKFNHGQTSNSKFGQLLMPLARIPVAPVQWIKGHPERSIPAKPETKHRPASPFIPGVKWEDMSYDQKGISYADHIAGTDCEVNHTITAHEAANVITQNLPFILVDGDANYQPLLERVDHRDKRMQMEKYKARRDKYRTDANKPAKWVDTDTTLMVRMLMPPKTSLGQRGAGQRIGFDKHLNGSNRLKYFKDPLTAACTLCGSEVEDQDHVLLHCTHGEHDSMRKAMLAEAQNFLHDLITAKSPAALAVTELLTLLTTHPDRAGLHTGILSPALRAEILQNKTLAGNCVGTTRSTIDKLFALIGKHTIKIVSYHNHYAYEQRKATELGSSYTVKGWKPFSLKKTNGMPIHNTIQEWPLLERKQKAQPLSISYRSIEYYFPPEKETQEIDKNTGLPKPVTMADIVRGRIIASEAACHHTLDSEGNIVLTQNERRVMEGRRKIAVILENTERNTAQPISKLRTQHIDSIFTKLPNAERIQMSLEVRIIPEYSSSTTQLGISNFYKEARPVAKREKRRHKSSEAAKAAKLVISRLKTIRQRVTRRLHLANQRRNQSCDKEEKNHSSKPTDQQAVQKRVIIGSRKTANPTARSSVLRALEMDDKEIARSAKQANDEQNQRAADRLNSELNSEWDRLTKRATWAPRAMPPPTGPPSWRQIKTLSPSKKTSEDKDRSGIG